MIDTIFYFVPTLEEYETKLGTGDIAPRTIVFVTDTRSIYKNGIRYGGYNSSELNDIIDGKLSPVRDSVTNALQLIAALNDDLDGVIRDKLAEIQTIIDDTFSEYSWLKKNLGDVFAYSGFQDELNGFLTTVGVIKDSSAAWTSLLQDMQSITGRVANILDGTLIEAMIKGWISDGVAGIDLSTYALKADLDDYLQTGNFSSTLEGTNAFVQLRSDVDGAKSAIGAWSQTYGNDSITQKLGALIVDVNNLDDSVTTTLSSTIRQYLGNDLQNGVDSYLQQQAGLILDSNLDSAVANLFASTTSTKTAVDNMLAAGFIAKSDLTGAAATQYATNGNLTAAITAGITEAINGNNASSFISAIADNVNIAGNLNVVNGNKTVAYIDNTGHASFIDGHVYLPYQATDWMTAQERATVGLYVDSVATAANNSATYANANWDELFHPRTLIEPDGLRFENSNKALAGSVKTSAVYGIGTNTNTDISEKYIDSYCTSIVGYDPTNNLNYVALDLKPALTRPGHASTDGWAALYNNKSSISGYMDNRDVWTGRCEINGWHTVVVDSSDEVLIRSNRESVSTGAGGISLRGNIRIRTQRSLNATESAVTWGTGVFNSDTAMNVSSDERKKDIVNNIQIPIEDIADVRIVDFTWKNDQSGKVYSGTIAQDWLELIPSAVAVDAQDGSLYLDYSAVGVISAVTAAKEIVALKEENRQLKERLARIEAALNIN